MRQIHVDTPQQLQHPMSLQIVQLGQESTHRTSQQAQLLLAKTIHAQVMCMPMPIAL